VHCIGALFNCLTYIEQDENYALSKKISFGQKKTDIAALKELYKNA